MSYFLFFLVFKKFVQYVSSGLLIFDCARGGGHIKTHLALDCIESKKARGDLRLSCRIVFSSVFLLRMSFHIVFYSVFGTSGPHSGAILGPSWGLLGPFWGHLGAILGPFWGHLGVIYNTALVLPLVVIAALTWP